MCAWLALLVASALSVADAFLFPVAHPSLPARNFPGAPSGEFSRGPISLLRMATSDALLAKLKTGKVALSATEAEEVSCMLQSNLITGWESKTYDIKTVDPLIEALVARGAPWDDRTRQLLANGKDWVVCYTKGEKPKWFDYERLLPKFRNKSGQNYNAQQGDLNGQMEGLLENSAQIIGDYLRIAGSGSFIQADPAADKCPVLFDVQIERGEFLVLGNKLGLPISGKGQTLLLYIDENVRVITSPSDSEGGWEKAGLVVVQVPADALE